MRFHSHLTLPLTLAGFAWAALLPCASAATLEELLAEAHTAARAGKSNAAAQAFNKAIALDLTEARPYFFRGQWRETQKEYAAAIEDYTTGIKLEPHRIDLYQRRGEARFKAGDVKGSAEDFDQVVRMSPREAPEHWQRGISLYYAGRFEEGRKQFELHQKVNSQDVENAVWHFLCLARERGASNAQAQLIDIQADRRVPMMEVHQLFQGKTTPEAVLKAAEAVTPDYARNQALFFAHLYIGLHHEGWGRTELARNHLRLAATSYSQAHYMGDVARTHMKVRGWK